MSFLAINSKGAAGLFILFGIVYFMAGMVIYQFVKPVITDARTDMTCSAPDTPGDKFVCLIFDGIIPYFIIGVLAASGSIFTSEVLK